MDKQFSTYCVIPTEVMLDNNISSTSKLMYGIISSLTNNKGYCWASNEYLGGLLDISRTRASLIIKELLDAGLIDIEIENNYKRKITILTINLKGVKEKLKGDLRKVKGGVKEKLKGDLRKVKDNNIIEYYKDNNNCKQSLQDEYSFKKQLDKMLKDKDRRMNIIAYYWVVKGYNFDNKKKYATALKRELRPAGDLLGYANEEIKKTCNWLKENSNFKWTIETIIKYIDEPLDELKTGGKQKTEEDFINMIRKQNNYKV